MCKRCFRSALSFIIMMYCSRLKYDKTHKKNENIKKAAFAHEYRKQLPHSRISVCGTLWYDDDYVVDCSSNVSTRN